MVVGLRMGFGSSFGGSRGVYEKLHDFAVGCKHAGRFSAFWVEMLF